jgi:hypothetical protein
VSRDSHAFTFAVALIKLDQKNYQTLHFPIRIAEWIISFHVVFVHRQKWLCLLPNDLLDLADLFLNLAGSVYLFA